MWKTPCRPGGARPDRSSTRSAARSISLKEMALCTRSKVGQVVLVGRHEVVGHEHERLLDGCGARCGDEADPIGAGCAREVGAPLAMTNGRSMRKTLKRAGEALGQRPREEAVPRPDLQIVGRAVGRDGVLDRLQCAAGIERIDAPLVEDHVRVDDAAVVAPPDFTGARRRDDVVAFRNAADQSRRRNRSYAARSRVCATTG